VNITYLKTRFKGYSQPPVMLKLGDICKVNQGLQIPISDRYLEPVPECQFYITNEFLKQGSKKRFYIKNPPASVVCDEKDILMTRTGNTGQVVTGVSGAFHNNFFKINYDNKKYYKNYLVQYLRSPKIQNNIMKLAGSSTIPDLNHSDFYSILIPSIELDEQQKIADFLSSVDTKISQLTEKHRLLKGYKKGVMQQIFSQQIRFKNDDGNDFTDWEEKSLGSLFDWIRTNNLSREKLSENVTALQNIHYGDIHTKYHSQFVQIRENIPYVVDAEIGKLVSQADFCKNGDIVIADASEDYADIGKAIEIISVKEGTLVAGLHTYIARPKNKFASGYLGYLFQFNGTRKQVQKLAQGVSVLGISKGNIETIKLSVPHIDEQKKIAQFLQSLDKKIDAVNDQIEQTKLFKKGLLQQMFV
tara:strand:+ start:2566 stop:3813 length:1248 start_codon:yes stop_codon:yes gene_type:complete